jgi:hypothetical protein
LPGFSQQAFLQEGVDLVKRDFTSTAPNPLWLTDITEQGTDEGKLYLWAIKDYSNGSGVAST